MQDGELVVRGYKELLRGLRDADKNTRKEVRAALRASGESVKAAAAQNALDRFHNAGRTAAGYRVVVRQRGVSVEQGVRKVTGKRPDYGGLQMKDALIPALDQNEEKVKTDMELAMDKVAAIFNAGG